MRVLVRCKHMQASPSLLLTSFDKCSQLCEVCGPGMTGRGPGPPPPHVKAPVGTVCSDVFPGLGLWYVLSNRFDCFLHFSCFFALSHVSGFFALFARFLVFSLQLCTCFCSFLHVCTFLALHFCTCFGFFALFSYTVLCSMLVLCIENPKTQKTRDPIIQKSKNPTSKLARTMSPESFDFWVF